jgi:hypothetical protein
MSGGVRNGCKEDWVAGETNFIRQIWCSSVYSAFEWTSALNRSYSVAEYGLIRMVRRLLMGFLMCGR